ncbi:MAG: metallophosphoesterase [Methanotrichaceae archaeon]|nr:metallophosphoesterase [Methanotrichaceae archaeon]
MTSIAILSDTHLEVELPEKLVEIIQKSDLVLHAGDFVSRVVYNSLKDLSRLEAVQGNADSPELKKLLPLRKVLEVDDIKIGLVHRASHSANLTGADMLAREMDVEILIFGHLHRPIVEKGDRILLCPGSPTLPRMSPPTMAELIIEKGKVSGRIIPLGIPICDYLIFAESLTIKEKNKIS